MPNALRHILFNSHADPVRWVLLSSLVYKQENVMLKGRCPGSRRGRTWAQAAGSRGGRSVTTGRQGHSGPSRSCSASPPGSLLLCVSSFTQLSSFLRLCFGRGLWVHAQDLWVDSSVLMTCPARPQLHTLGLSSRAGLRAKSIVCLTGY